MDMARKLLILFGASAAALSVAGCGEPDVQPPAGQSAAATEAEDTALRAAFEAADWPQDVSDLPADVAVRYGVLGNGMRYAILENDTPSNSAAMRLVFDIGSLAETEAQRGLAHFIEHMAFNGTTNVPEGEMVPLLERYGLAFGPDTNAFTSREVVGYQLSLPGTEEQIVETGLFLLRETAAEMTFDTGAIDRERGIILGEERYRNTPIRRYFSAYYDYLYPDTIIAARDAIGTTEVIENAGRELFVDYYENFYTPERALLVVAGQIDAEQIEEKIREGFEYSAPGLDIERVDSFASWEQPEDAPGDPDIGMVPAFTEPGYGYFYDPEVFTLINVDVITPGPEDLDTVENRRRSLLRQLGNSIVQRRLQSRINSGTSPLVQANLSYTNDFGLANRAGAFAVSSPENWRDGLAVLEQELRRASEHGFTRAELDEQLANLRTALRNAAEQAATRESGRLADQLWQSWLNGDVFTHPEFALRWFEDYASQITVERVEDAFAEIWTAAPAQVYVAANQEIENADAAVQQAWEASQAEPVTAPEETETAEFAYESFGEPGNIVSTRVVEDLDVHQYVFDNGVRLNVKQTGFEDNSIRVRVDFGSGDLTPQPSPAAGSILGAVFGGGGLEAHDRDELQRILAGRSVGYGVGVADDTFFFSNETTPTDFELQMKVLTAFMTAPGWREDGLNQFRAISEEIMRGMNAQAVQVAVNHVGRMLRNGDPRWGFPTQEEVEAFSMEHARQFLANSLENAPIEITIVGDIEPQAAVDTVAATFGALPERAADWPPFEPVYGVSFPEPTNEPEIVRFNGQDYQGMANVYWPTDDGMETRRSRALTLLRAVYDLKATERFREQEGATYSAIVSNTQSEVFEDYGYLWVGLDVEVGQIDRMYEIADELAASLAAGEISQDELLRARQPILESIETSQETNRWWLSSLSRSQARPERLDDIRTITGDYEAVNAQEITELARQYLQPDRAFRVTILPQDVDPSTTAGAGEDQDGLPD